MRTNLLPVAGFKWRVYVSSVKRIIISDYLKITDGFKVIFYYRICQLLDIIKHGHFHVYMQ